MHDVGMAQALEDLHFAPHALLVPLDFLRNGLQRDIVRDVRSLGGVSMRGRMGCGRGDREDGCGRGGLGGGCEGGRGRRGGAALTKVPPVLMVRAMSRAVVAVRRSGGCAHTVVVVVVTYLGGVVAAVVVVVVATRWAAWAAIDCPRE